MQRLRSSGSRTAASEQFALPRPVHVDEHVRVQLLSGHVRRPKRLQADSRSAVVVVLIAVVVVVAVVVIVVTVVVLVL